MLDCWRRDHAVRRKRGHTRPTSSPAQANARARVQKAHRATTCSNALFHPSDATSIHPPLVFAVSLPLSVAPIVVHRSFHDPPSVIAVSHFVSFARKSLDTMSSPLESQGSSISAGQSPYQERLISESWTCRRHISSTLLTFLPQTIVATTEPAHLPGKLCQTAEVRSVIQERTVSASLILSRRAHSLELHSRRPRPTRPRSVLVRRTVRQQRQGRRSRARPPDARPASLRARLAGCPSAEPTAKPTPPATSLGRFEHLKGFFPGSGTGFTV